MAIVPPSNLLNIKYASEEISGANILVLASDLTTPYVGYYYEIGGRTFAGKEYNSFAPELVRKPDTPSSNKNVLFTSGPSTEEYSKLSGIVITSTPLKTIPFTINKQDIKNKYKIRYFVKKLYDPNIIIREVNEESYKLLSKDLFHQLLKLKFTLYPAPTDYDYYDTLMPGLKTYLQNEKMIIL